MKSFSSRFGRSQCILALLASTAVFTAGCANMATTAVGSSFQSEAATIGGRIHGGVQPVASATVQLWFAGQGSVGATLVAQTSSASTGSIGSFSFVKGADGGANAGTNGNTWSCPLLSVGNPLVYVVASGGNTQNNGDSTSNSAAAFVSALGLCQSVGNSTFVELNEVTTVATMAVWQQYFNPSVPAASSIYPIAGSFNSDGSGLSLQSMTSSYNLLANLVNIQTGAANTTKTIPASMAGGTVGVLGLSVTATPEAAKLNTIANILASCINLPTYTPGATDPCNTLFSNAVHPDPTTTSNPAATFSPAVDTLHAAYYMLTNPTDNPVGTTTSNLGSLYGLFLANGAAFTPTLGTQPTDWTIGISYAGPTTLCGATTNPVGHLINSVQDIAIDSRGGVWLANNEPGGNVGLLSNTGAPEGCIKIGSGLNTGITLDAANPGGLQNIWLADSGGTSIYEYPPGGTPIAYSTTTAPVSIAADASSTIYYTSNSNLYGLVAGNPTPMSIATAVGTGSRVLVDSSPAIWATSGTTSISRTTCTIIPGTPGPPVTLPSLACSSTPITTDGPTYGIGVSPLITVGSTTPHLQNSVYISAGTGTSSLSLFQGGPATPYQSVWDISSTTTPTTPPTTPPTTTTSAPGLNNPAAVAVDGAQNVWAINNAPIATSVVEIGAAKQQLSGATGFVKDASYLGKGRSLIIDSSGNVWIGLDGTNSITEIVGAAVPVYQPYAVGLQPNSHGVIQFQKIP